MTTFVITAAGRGTRIGRVGEKLHKALVPLNGKAVLSHIIDLVPANVKLVICVGHMADQIRDYVELAHPQLDVTFVDVPNWDEPDGGPGASLLAARDEMTEDGHLIFTSCDTLWDRDQRLWQELDFSWIGLAPIPPGTDASRWTVVQLDDDHENIAGIIDKDPEVFIIHNRTYAWTGLGFIHSRDLIEFWHGIADIFSQHGETQIPPGLHAITHKLTPRFINWTDVGDEAAYRAAVQRFTGYDFVKLDQATYVLPEQGRVVKFNADGEAVTHRVHRASALEHTVPKPIRGIRTDTLMAHPYVPGVTAYQAIARDGVEVTKRMLEWFRNMIFSSRHGAPSSDAAQARELLMQFYWEKTHDRIRLLNDQLRRVAHQAVNEVDFNDLISRAVWGVPHGDFNYGNVIVTPGGEFVGIDWRENFAGAFFGDLRYDLGKMLAGTYVHWDRAQHGDLRPWSEGAEHAELILAFAWDVGINRDDVRTIAGLSLINSAPLHAEPLCGVAVSRGVALLNEIQTSEYVETGME